MDERRCGVNDMNFEQWERCQDQMLRYYSVYQHDNGPYKEENENDSSEEDESSDEDDEWDENHRSCHCNNEFCLTRVTSPGWHPGQDEDDESDDDNHHCVCLWDPTDIREGTCCCNHLGLRCNGNMSSRWIRQVTRGSASDPLVLLKAISLFLLKTIHLKKLKEILLC